MPWKIVFVRTENWRRHLAHFQTRRTLGVRFPSAFGLPVPLVPPFGVRKYALSWSQTGQTGWTLPPQVFQQKVGVVLVVNLVSEIAESQLHKPVLLRLMGLSSYGPRCLG